MARGPVTDMSDCRTSNRSGETDTLRQGCRTAPLVHRAPRCRNVPVTFMLALRVERLFLRTDVDCGRNQVVVINDSSFDVDTL